MLSQLPNLRLVITTGMRNASLDVAYLAERGITVCGTQFAGGDAARGARARSRWRGRSSSRWPSGSRRRTGRCAPGAGSSTSRRTWRAPRSGLCGLGNLGAAMVGPARAFGMEVIAWSQNLTDERAAEVGVRRVSKEELLAAADFLSIHLVLTTAPAASSAVPSCWR